MKALVLYQYENISDIKVFVSVWCVLLIVCFLYFLLYQCFAQDASGLKLLKYI